MCKRWRNRKGIYVGMETLIRGYTCGTRVRIGDKTLMMNRKGSNLA